jgi:hypothetical protein
MMRRAAMLLYSTRTAVFKNGDKSTLLCKITLPSGTCGEGIRGDVVGFYKGIYEATYLLAREYAAHISPRDNRLFTLKVSCAQSIKKGVLKLRRTYKITGEGNVIKEMTFTDKFKINVIKQRNIPSRNAKNITKPS